MIDIVIFLGLMLVITAAGSWLVGKLKVPFSSVNERLIFSAAVGLGACTLFVYVLGLCGFLRVWVLATVIAVLFFSLRERAKEILCTAAGALWKAVRVIAQGPRYIAVIAALAFAGLFLCLLGALTPPLCNDSLAYRLYFPKLYSAAGRIVSVPFQRSLLWPGFMEMLFTVSLLVRGDIVAKLFSFAMLPLTCASIWLVGRAFFNRTAGFLGAVIFLFTPAVFIQATFSYSDIAMALYLFLSFYAFLIWFQTSHVRWALVSGILAGFCASIKYTGLQAGVLMSVLFTLAFLTHRKKIIKPWLFFFGGLLVVSCVWYIRSYLVTGNPVFPFAYHIFHQGWTQKIIGREGAGMGVGFAQAIMLLWNITLYPLRFGGETIGPAYLMFLPSAVLIKKTNKVFGISAIAAALLLVIWFFSVQIARFFFMPLVVMALLLGAALDDLFNRARYYRKFFIGLFAAVMIVNFLHCLYYSRGALRYFAKNISRSEYLSHSERTFAVAKAASGMVPPGSTILLVGEPRLYYFDRAVVYEDNFSRSLHIENADFNDRDLARLLNKYGFNYILVREVETNNPDPGEDTTLKKGLLEEDFIARHLTLLYSTRFASGSESPSRYRFYMLKSL